MAPGNIILLNGPASAGKTSILVALQEVLDAPYLNAGLDKFLFMLPDRYLERPLWDEVLGQTTQAGVRGRPGLLDSQLISGMHHAIAALARAGNPVIADHVLIEPCWLRECAQLFCELPTFFVGVRCPLEILEAREQARGQRPLGQARAQFDVVHTPGIYDLEVDTARLSPLQCALQIKHRLHEGPPPTAIRRLKAWTNSTWQREWVRRGEQHNLPAMERNA
jgi:chloramphenicol 3-O phosphotransferase